MLKHYDSKGVSGNQQLEGQTTCYSYKISFSCINQYNDPILSNYSLLFYQQYSFTCFPLSETYKAVFGSQKRSQRLSSFVPLVEFCEWLHSSRSSQRRTFSAGGGILFMRLAWMGSYSFRNLIRNMISLCSCMNTLDSIKSNSEYSKNIVSSYIQPTPINLG